MGKKNLDWGRGAHTNWDHPPPTGFVGKKKNCFPYGTRVPLPFGTNKKGKKTRAYDQRVGGHFFQIGGRGGETGFSGPQGLEGGDPTSEKKPGG